MPTIFICYRKDDAGFEATWIFDELAKRFDRNEIFIDIEKRGGTDMRLEIDKQVGECGFMIAVIGKSWLTICGEDGKRRLDNPNDWVRLEIEAALNRPIRKPPIHIIPVLVGEARMTEPEKLPSALQAFAFRKAISINPKSRQVDLQELIDRIVKLEPPESPRAGDDSGMKNFVGFIIAALAICVAGYGLWSAGSWLDRPTTQNGTSTTTHPNVAPVPDDVPIEPHVYKAYADPKLPESIFGKLLDDRAKARAPQSASDAGET